VPGALDALEEDWRVASRLGVTSLLNPVPALRARLLLAQGDLAAAVRWTQERGLGEDDEVSYPREPEYLVLARVLLAQDVPDRALALLDRLHALAAAQGRTGSVIEIQALRAVALAAAGDQAGAATTLAGTLGLASPEGYVRVFADEGAPMHTLGLVETLSERELEVLRLLAEGKPNREIADELYVAVDTVKKHVTHIFEKLGAANRTQATARARELGLLADATR
jgi:LuxR family maltose regulon positive regulatory protein